MEWTPITVAVISLTGALGATFANIYHQRHQRHKDDIIEFYKEELRHSRENEAFWRDKYLTAHHGFDQALQTAEEVIGVTT